MSSVYYNSSFLCCSRFGIVNPRGAHARARYSRRNLVFGWVHGTRTMMQLFGSAVGSEAAGPFWIRLQSHGCVRVTTIFGS